MALLVPALRCCSLEKPETLASGEVLAAMCHLLSLVLGRVPNQILRAKFAAGSQVLCGILEAKQVRPNHRQAPLSSLPARFCSAQALHNLRARRPPPPPPPPCFPQPAALPCSSPAPMQGDVAVVKNAVPCLGQLLAAVNHADWPSAVRPFTLLQRWLDRHFCQL